MADEKRSPALCLALVDPLPIDMAAAAEWYVAEVQRLDNAVQLEKRLEGHGDIAHEFHTDSRGVEIEENLASSGH